MGRLAGNSPRWEAVMLEHRKLEKARQRLLAAVTPVAHPPARRRQMALLWYIGVYACGSMIVGRRGYPPRTDDMRALLRKNYLALKRAPVYAGKTLPLCNSLTLTSSGEAALARTRVTDADRTYIQRARDTWVLR